MKYYMKGGRIYKTGGVIKKYQDGGDADIMESIRKNLENATVNSNPDPAPTEGYKSPLTEFLSNKENVSAAGSLLGQGMTALADNNKSRNSGDAGGKYVAAANRGLDGQGINKGMNSALSTAAMLDPTGTSQIVKAAVDIGKGASNLIKNEDQYGVSQSGVQEVLGNALDPIGRLQKSFDLSKKYGAMEGVKNFATFGISGRNTQKNAIDRALNAEKREDAMMSYGNNTGNYKNNSVYAQAGAYLRNKPINDMVEPNAEIEDGELVIGNPKAVKLMGDVDTSMESKFGFKVHGDKHGQDTDNDGMEGIPVAATEENYVASEYLGVDGKKSGKGNPSVAKVMGKNLNFLHQAERNPSDKYKNNPIALALQRKEMENTIHEAERNKFKEKLRGVAKKKDVDLNELVQVIGEMPKKNMSSDEQMLLESALQSSVNNSTMLDEIQQSNPELNNKEMGFNNYYSRGGYYQQGGGMMPMEQEQADPSGEYGQELAAMAPGMEGEDMGAAPQLAPEVQEMFNQLPPEMQEQIMQLPPEQMEPAIMSAFEQMQGGAGPIDPAMEGGMDPMMDPMMGGMEGMDPSAMAEQQAIMRMGGYNSYKGGGRMKPGCKVKFEMGGRMMEGTLRGYNADGSMNIG